MPASSPERAAGETPDGARAQALAERLHEWVATGWGGTRPGREQFAGLGQMYVADPRFTAYYDEHGEGTAVFVRDAVAHYANNHL